jgi:hypothetical protein
MDALGLIFTNVQCVHGPILIATQPAKRITFLGELHHVNGTKEPASTHILDVIESYAKEHPAERFAILFEANNDDLFLLRDSYTHQPSPLKMLANQILSRHKHPDNLSLVLGNARRDPPFGILEVVYNFEAFVKMHIARNSDFNPMYRKAWKDAKMFEKALFNRIKTRAQCIEFMMGLIDPGLNTPVWLLPHLANFGISNTENRVKNALAKCKKKNTMLYVAIMRVVNDMFSETVAHNSNFSAALERANNTRATASPNMVADRHSTFRTFLIALHAIAMDVFILINLFELQESNDHVVVLAGINHIINIIEHLPHSSFVHAANMTGNLGATDVRKGMRQLRSTGVFQDLLCEFLKSDKKSRQ